MSIPFQKTTVDRLKEHAQWICYNADKMPYNPHTGYGADCNNPETWTTFSAAMQVYQSNPNKYKGVGFEFVKEQGITGVDLDKCIDDEGNFSPFAQEVVRRLNSYTEYSPSGKGLHIWVRGSIPNNIGPNPKLDGNQRIEAYDCLKYFTVTEKHLPGTSKTIEDRQEELTALFNEITARRQAAKKATKEPQQRATNPETVNTLYGLKALNAECHEVATMPEGGRNDRLNQAAYSLGQLVGGGELLRETVERKLTMAAEDAGLGTREIERTIKSGMENGMKQPRKSPVDEICDNGPHGMAGEDKEKKVSVAKILLEMSAPLVEVFCDNGGIKYARVPVRAHHETMIIGENGAFRLWLHHLYEQTTGSIPNTNAVSDVIRTYAARALFQEEAKIQEVYLRTAYIEETNTIYLDMANSNHQVIKITRDGWHIIDKAPVLFRRTPNMAPLPTPVRGGSVEELRPFINCRDEEWPLVKAWVHGCLQPAGLDFGEYAILNLTGGQGAAKTSAAKRLRSVFDPSIAPLRKAPKDAQAFAIMAHNNFVVGLDNLSHISNDLSDSMCTLSTGAGDAYRTLYTDADETVFVAKRPQVITGIEQLATRGDLLDRCLLVSLQDIPDDARITSSDLNKRYKEAHPRILGAFLDCASLALRERDNVHEKELPRLADFAQFVLAAHPLLFLEHEAFLEVYKKNREEGVTNELEASPVAAAVLRLMQGTETYSDTSENLLTKLTALADDKITKSKLWPLTPRGLSAQLTRLSRSLRQVGINIKKSKSNGERNIILTHTLDRDAKFENRDAKFENRDAKFENRDAKFENRDAKFENRDAKFEVCATGKKQVVSETTTTGTQSGAKNPLFYPLAEEKEKKEEKVESQKLDKDVTKKNAENLRHFASLKKETSAIQGTDCGPSDVSNQSCQKHPNRPAVDTHKRCEECHKQFLASLAEPEDNTLPEVNPFYREAGEDYEEGYI